MRARRAFTLVELLVVIAIIGVLVALLLPAIQYARESARRTQCTNHLRNVGVALHNFHDVHQHLPAGWYADAPDGEPGWGWGAYLLHYLEQNSLLDSQIDLEAHIDESENDAARRAVIPIYLCPSDANAKDRVMLTGLHTPLFEVGRSNYVGVFGTEEIEVDPGNGDGTFFYNSWIRFADIRDGLSNTLLVGERSSRYGSSTWVGMVHGATDAMARVVGSCDHVPNDPHAHFEDFGSYHATGANFVLGDASVRLIGSDIDLSVYHALATRAGGEPASKY
ncbi:MAG TPA: DUF1559 domain-containing protein [Candidatus Anammoximicrobium sp.]|nr:DUF1559 domain-containing protein [Candidatus Anammoximicrobium sp.]